MSKPYSRETLSPREREVMEWAARGKSCWATGQILGISEHTVSFYRKQAVRKLGAACMAQALYMAGRVRLLEDAV